MHHVLRTLLASLLVGSLLPVGVYADEQPSAAKAASSDGLAKEGDSKGALDISVYDFRKLEGQLLLAVFDSKEGFPNDIKRSVFHQAYPVDRERLHIRLTDLEPGTYAVAIHHDEDKDFEMDKGWFGIPREGYGASRDAKARFGPPKFDDARFTLTPGQTRRLNIRVRYF